MAKIVRGFKDTFGEQAENLTKLENCAREVFALYGVDELRIPTIELKELFIKSTGDTTDIVQKEMYAFEDAGGRNIALRPEGTPGIVRAYIENGFAQNNPLKSFYYIGNMFRAERPQAGRYREFEQIGVECFGNQNPAQDAQTILMLKDIVERYGIKNYKVRINSLGCGKCRPAFRQELINFFSASKDQLCDKCKDRLERNPLRVLDCKIDGPKFTNVPKQKLCPDCQAHFDEVLALLKGKIDFEVDPMLVRGLDYYTQTVFEFVAGTNAQNAIAGGGRYDTLVKSMGGPACPAVGWALGAQRVASVLEEQTKAEENIQRENKFFVISMDKTCNQTAFDIMQKLRQADIKTLGGIFDKNIKSQMKQADKNNCRWAIIIGSSEVEKNTFVLKDLNNAEQKEYLQSEVISILKKVQNEKN